MNKNYLINSLFIGLIAASPLAGAETKYPASDFQPQVVFQDDDYIKNSKVNTAAADAKPAYSASEADPKYPAANFQPQVVYSDANYKHNTAPVTESKSDDSVAMAASTGSESTSSTSKAEAKDSSSTYLIGLVGLVLAGVFLMRGQSQGSSSSSTKSTGSGVAAHPGGLTGVARYINKANGTGVSRYLEKQVKSAATKTGVAKYVAKQALAAKSSATEAATGVEKYLRDRG